MFAIEQKIRFARHFEDELLSRARIAPRFVDALLGNFGSKERHKMGKQNRFTNEFKRDAVAQVVDRGYPVREVAERMGISTKSIYTWQRLFSRPVKVIQEVDAQAGEIRRLKRDLARVASGRDILKKATAYFARESPPTRFAGKPLPGYGSMQVRIYADLLLQALPMAVWRRKPKAKVYVHSDQGSQFTSYERQEFLEPHNLGPSMSRVGTVGIELLSAIGSSRMARAVVESFFNRLKRERIRRKIYKTREEARRDVFALRRLKAIAYRPTDDIEFFYNPKRKHVRNGMLSPIAFEQQQKLKLQGVRETRGYSRGAFLQFTHTKAGLILVDRLS